MKICICDDKLDELKVLESLCKEYLLDEKVDADLVCTQNPRIPIEENFDLLILDIEMPEISGIEVKNALFGRERPLIIFATSYEENMKNAFGPNVMGFMKKPVDQEDFSFYVSQAIQLLTAGKFVELKKGEPISTEQIVMFTTDEKYTVAVLTDGTLTTLSDKSISTWENELADTFFIRVSSSHLINCKYIDKFVGDFVILKSGEKVKISRRKKAVCLEQLMAFRRKNQRFA